MDAGHLAQQVNAAMDQLHGLFDEIGVPEHARLARMEEISRALSTALHNQVRQITAEKDDMLEEARRTINAIRQMETSLDDSRPRRTDYDADEELQVTYPLSRCLQVLKEKHQQIAKIHRERFEQVRKLVDALESYSSHLESTFVRIALPPTGPNQSIPINFDLSPSYVDKLDAEFTRVYEEYTRRVAVVQALCEDVIQLWAELGTPQAQTDSAIVKHYRDAPEQLGLHEDDLARLRARRDKLADEKKAREKRLRDLKAAVETLWGKLGVEEHEKKSFLNGNRGCGIRQINEFEDELARLNELKRQNLPAFVEDARCKLQELWDALYLSEDEMLEFTPAFSDVYSDALLEAHEREIARLEALREQRAPTLALVDRHQALIRERDELAASSQDASRLMMRGQKGERRDPGKLLREEKTRKRIAKELPKVTAELRKVLEAWEDEYGRPFLVHGERYLDSVYSAGGGAGSGTAGTAAPGPRSKTPAGPPPSAAKSTAKKRTPGTGIVVAAAAAAASRTAAPSRAGAKTPTAAPSRLAAANGTIRRTTAAATANGSSKMSPSRIPAATTASRATARAPLGTLKHGGNSPERPRLGAPATSGDAAGKATQRGGAPMLMRAPPPKMRELIRSPVLGTPAANNGAFRSAANLGSSIHVRHVEPEDVYDDERRHKQQQQQQFYEEEEEEEEEEQYEPYEQYEQHEQHEQYGQYDERYYDGDGFDERPSTAHRRPASQQSQHSSRAHAAAAAAAYAGQFRPAYQPASRAATGSVRQISNTSTAVSGSENWETYDDNSEAEADASEAYYAKLRAARGKRASPDGQENSGPGGHGRPGSSMAKRLRGLPPPALSGAGAGPVTVDENGHRIVSGSEWTDEDAF